MTRVKICGIKTEADAVAAAEAGADFIGVVLAASPRQVSPEQAKRIAAAVRSCRRSARVVGVFVNTVSTQINRLADSCGMDFVQLSGDESFGECARIERPVIKAFHVGDSLPDELGVNDVQASGQKLLYLLDTHVPGKYGGTGTSFDWDLAREVCARLPVVLAGGLTPENVAEAIDRVQPWGVDVSSGVETDGVKDLAKVRAFISAVRRANGARA